MDTGIEIKRLRSMTWDDYGISRGRYKELQGFCLQYRQKQKEAKRLSDYALAAAEGTEGAQLHYQRAERAAHDCRMIEEAAMWAAAAGGYTEAWRTILSNVTDGIGYEKLCCAFDLPISHTDFYGMRRAFFHRLDQLQHNGSQ